MFKNGTLHVTGSYSLDTSEFVIKAFVGALNAISTSPFSYLSGKVLLANYRLTMGLRMCLPSAAVVAREMGHVPWLEHREHALVVKMRVEGQRWASVRLFSTGSCAISVPSCETPLAQVDALCSVVAFLHGLVEPV